MLNKNLTISIQVINNQTISEQGSLTLFYQEEFMKKHKFVIADSKRCIGCATCMAACFRSAYERGKLSRARLSVLREASGVMPTQCRQCDDGPCANVCPTGALRFNDNCIELHEEICIGCKMCTIACPYGAISSSAELMPSVNYAVEPKYYLEVESQ